ncbi:MAG TPA: AraC family transcriptional regulator [Burkholderiales bacterium]|nr:AraC family transcriptional regulator [Burkholderiales bacterium]
MQATRLYAGDALSVHLYRCSAGPADRPFAEVHARHSLSYVRRGSFGCRTLGTEHHLVPGAVLVGRPGQEYMATHEHDCGGDECVSITVSPELAETLFPCTPPVCIPPLAELMVAAEARDHLATEEAALFFAERAARLVSGVDTHAVVVDARSRRRAIDAALWLEENAAEPVGLEAAARRSGLSPFHFLRLFKRVVGVTPHQYLLRVRLRRAAKLLTRGGMAVTEVALECGFADLSNFVRTFRRAAGVPPAIFSKRHAAALA